MKTLMKTSLSAVALLLALPACAQDAPKPAPESAPKSGGAPSGAPADADPALWVVRDADTTIYLFGTVHVLKPGLTWFDEAVKTAFDGSGELVLEMVQPDQATQGQVMGARAFSSAGPTLAEQLPAAYRPKLATAVADSGLPAAMLERAKPWFASVLVSMAPLGKLGYAPANGPEEVLAAAARAAGKPVTGLETFEQQIGFFDTLSQPGQVKMLTGTLDELPGMGGTMAQMVTDWSRGDPDALAREMNDQLKGTPEVAKVLLTDRNARWATWIAGRMARPGTVFIAVGAGHLAGAGSVQAQLVKSGLKAERVAY